MTSPRLGGLRRLAEFGDVGAGEKGAPGAGDHDRLDGSVVARLAQRLGEPGADLVLQRVDRRVVDGDDRDSAVAAQIDAGVDIAHAGSTLALREEITRNRAADEGAQVNRPLSPGFGRERADQSRDGRPRVVGAHDLAHDRDPAGAGGATQCGLVRGDAAQRQHRPRRRR